MPYRQRIERCLADAVAGGVSEAALAARLADADEALAAIRAAAGSSAMAFLAQPARRDDLNEIADTADLFRGTFRHVIVLGTGGSSLGGQALTALVQGAEGGPRNAPRLHFVDNADPAALVPLLDPERLRESGIIAISKSGGTAETLAQLLCVIDAVRAAESAVALTTRLAVVTQRGDSPLRRLAKRFGLAVIDHPGDVGGRFSALTVSGLLPAMIAGLDGGAIRAGGQEVVAAGLGEAAARDYPPALGAAVAAALAAEAGCSQSVLMPYGSRLRPFAGWWRQLWAESLGKGGAGTTPIDALGSVDQHSQLQLYLDGPRDKMFTILGVDEVGPDAALPDDLTGDPDLGYLAGRSLGDVLTAMRSATVDSLTAAGRPVREIAMARLDGAAIGALMMHFMIETVIMAHLMNVDPFGQPAVEDGKRRAREYLARGPQ
jgi:glucose-6-phosphate isomerase